MIRCIKLKFETNAKEPLLDTMRQASDAFNICTESGFKEKTSSKNKVHHATYYKIREKYPSFPAALVQATRDTACEALKGVKLKRQPTKKEHSSIRYDKRTARINLLGGEATLSTTQGRIKGKLKVPDYFKKYLTWKVGGCTLNYKNKEFYLHIFVETDTPKSIGSKVLGIDRGINNIAVCSDNSFVNSKHTKRIKGKYAHLRKELQSKGTRSAKRKLKKIAERERRFVRNSNHIIANGILSKPYDVFALEDLTNIRVQKRLGKRFNQKLGNWSFNELEQIMKYKAEGIGKKVILIDGRYSSQKCSKCGYTSRSNRKTSDFKCGSCGLKLHADLNAARNIAEAGISCLGRLSVNEPNVAQTNPIMGENEAVTSPPSLEVGN